MTSITGSSYLDTLTSSSSKTAATGTATSKSKTLDQNDFLKLLTTQLKTQDPFAPVDNSQMVAQMAQFSSVAGISEMNSSLKAMAGDISASRVGGAASWIGKSALVSSDIATPLSGGGYAGEVTLPSAAKSAQVTFTDADGNILHQSSYGETAAGQLAFAWDGKDAAGNAVATGPLAINVTAYAKNGTAMTATTSTWTPIASVESPASGATKLSTALGSISPSQVLRLS
ncbi:flagellar hook capping FlgD N-terminal domain-containing protein [Sphingomonas naphthae]|uniref:Basal-body rod modification protein FlgD n=1 Tax=Sphingomonas naphthae TaxID=1813468 RepID=A0ABY7TKZ7_9SPHN|nr:flagellar hook capping FlgD N-terminal domain-containing protein [Sphingomonas naphthae]WCT73641.1 flagellar hook capping FlgD N-terminal domain-containing protein [Sphingomonas naphthae]